MADELIEARRKFCQRVNLPHFIKWFIIPPVWAVIILWAVLDHQTPTPKKLQAIGFFVFLTGVGYFLVWALAVYSKPMKAFCPHCKGFIPSNTDWQCNRHGQHSVEHKSPTQFSVFNRCQKCEETPTAFICPHCEGLIYLTKERDGKTPATPIGRPVRKPDPPSPGPHDKLKADQLSYELQIEVKKREIDLALTKKQLAELEKHAALNSGSAWERHLEASLEKHLGLANAVMKKRLQLQKELAHDPVELKRHEDWLDKYYNDHIDEESPRVNRGPF